MFPLHDILETAKPWTVRRSVVTLVRGKKGYKRKKRNIQEKAIKERKKYQEHRGFLEQ